jgi:serine/threonine protein kinase
MAPEFLHGGTITPKSDIFSLGVIILEVITGHREYVDVTNTSAGDFIELVSKLGFTSHDRDSSPRRHFSFYPLTLTIYNLF